MEPSRALRLAPGRIDSIGNHYTLVFILQKEPSALLNDGEKGFARLGDAGNIEHAVQFGVDSIGGIGRGLEELVGEQVQPVLFPVQVEIGVIGVGRAGGEETEIKRTRT